MKSINIYKEQTMTSLEIAELTGKQHKDVMKAIRNMEPAWLKVNGRKFALVEYQDSHDGVRPHGEATGGTRAYHRPFLGDEVKSERRPPRSPCLGGRKGSKVEGRRRPPRSPCLGGRKGEEK